MKTENEAVIFFEILRIQTTLSFVYIETPKHLIAVLFYSIKVCEGSFTFYNVIDVL